MPWTPTFSVINARAIAANLLTYFETNQVDALAWANGGAGLLPFQRIENSVGNLDSPVYPAIMFSDDNDATDYAETLPDGAYSLTFEMMVTNPDPNVAVVEARKYVKAVTSMIRNCPQATYTANTDTQAQAASLQTIEIGFDPIKSNEMHNDFLQQFQIRATYDLSGSAI
jgi:hypothetical protein